MNYKHDGFNWIVRINKGEKLVESLNKLVEKENLSSCWVNAIGAALEVELGYYDLPNHKYNWRRFTDTMEITGLQGNLSFVDGQPNWHMHGTFSKSDYSVVGGHVKELTVGGTCEVFLHTWDSDKLTRTQDAEVGLKLLELEESL